MKNLSILILLLSSALANSGELIKNAKITKMANISGNVDGFYLNLDGGGEGPCVTTPIFFKKVKMPDESQEALNRAVSIASMAFAMDLYVQIHNYSDDDCYGASYIRVSKTPF